MEKMLELANRIYANPSGVNNIPDGLKEEVRRYLFVYGDQLPIKIRLALELI